MGAFGCWGAKERGKERQAVQGPWAPGDCHPPGSQSDGQGGVGGAAQGRDCLLQRARHHAKYLINDMI